MSRKPQHWRVAKLNDRIALGVEVGMSDVHKFGNNPVVDTTEELVWAVGGDFTLPSAPVTIWIACEDNTNGVGQVIRVDGLDANFDLQSVFVTLAGNTPVQVGDASNWWIVHRAYQVSAAPDPVGDVWIAQDDTDFVLGVPQTQTNIMGFIDYTNHPHQTEQALYMVPRNKVALVKLFEGSIAAALGSSRTVELGLEISEVSRETSLESSPTWAPQRRIATLNMRSDAEISAEESFVEAPLVFQAGTLIEARASATAASAVFATFDLTLYDI